MHRCSYIMYVNVALQIIIISLQPMTRDAVDSWDSKFLGKWSVLFGPEKSDTTWWFRIRGPLA